MAFQKRKISRRNPFARFRDTTKNVDWYLTGSVIILVLAGLAFLASGLSVKTQELFIQRFFKQFIIGVWVGGVLTFLLSRIDYHTWFKHKYILLVLMFSSLGYIALWTFIGFVNPGVYNIMQADNIASWQIVPRNLNNATRWIRFGNFTTVQPVEFAKLAILTFFAAHFNYLEEKRKEINFKNIITPLVVFLITAFIVVIQPDLGSVILIALIAGAAMWVAKTPLSILSSFVAVGIVAVGILATTASYRQARLDAAFLACNDISNEAVTCDQIRSINSAISRGGMWGVGYGQGNLKNSVPEVANDAIIAAIGEEMGFIFTTVFLGLYLVIFYRGMKIANQAPDIGGKALATGISVWIASQAFLNVMGMTGLTPSKGLPLPFVSEGQTSMIINFIAIGILLNISSFRIEEKPKTILDKIGRKKVS